VEELGLSQDIDIQMGTLGKALGCIGAYVAGNSDLIEWLTNRSRSFIYTTALLPSAAATALAALELVQKEPIRRIQLMGNASLLRNELSQLGFDLGKCSSQILPILIGSEKTTLSLQEELFNRGVWGQAVRPPTIPMGTSRIRLTPMATHTESQLKQVITAFSESGRALGIL
jgi:8-amino-7-oxononanoate synthase